ncbi:hypothetical protein JCM33374_g2587 [Metschnikowia sp. JCM 33374]|nr:hypothetical protein JCM33374_g2587 [Metschnikowia sp. JCM 33374]
MINKALQENTETDPKILRYIKETKYKEVLLGQFSSCTGKRPTNLAKFVDQKEKTLFDFINTVLQYPPCVEAVNRSDNTNRTYATEIRDYVSFMAKNGCTPSNFIVDGVAMRNCKMESLENSTKPQGAAYATINNHIFGMQKLQICLGIWKSRNKASAAQAAIEDWKIPRLHYIVNYKKDRLKSQRIVEKKEFHNKLRVLDEDYTPEQASQMMINMYQLTGKAGKTSAETNKNIFDGITAAHQFILGHHTMIRSMNKIMLEYSDLTLTKKTTNHQNVPILQYRLRHTKTQKPNKEYESVAACRNKKVEMCPLFTMANSLWLSFDFPMGLLYGERRPNFLDKSAWYNAKVLYINKDRSYG